MVNDMLNTITQNTWKLKLFTRTHNLSSISELCPNFNLPRIALARGSGVTSVLLRPDHNTNTQHGGKWGESRQIILVGLRCTDADLALSVWAQGKYIKRCWWGFWHRFGVIKWLRGTPWTASKSWQCRSWWMASFPKQVPVPFLFYAK